MANMYSEALAKVVAGDLPWDASLAGGKFILFKGSFPTLPETAVLAADEIMPLTLDSGVWVAKDRSISTITLTAIGAGNTIIPNVAGIQISPVFTAATSTVNDEATALALVINTSTYNLGVRAEAAANVVTLYAPFGTGILFDGIAVTNTGSGGTVALSGTFTGGVTGAYGLDFERDLTTKNKLVKPTAAVWSGTCPVGITEQVTPTFFRYILDPGDDGLLDDTSNKAFRRIQGVVGGKNSSSADLKFPLVSPSVIAGVQLQVGSYDFTIPLAKTN
jgi:hypothetical protein